MFFLVQCACSCTTICVTIARLDFAFTLCPSLSFSVVFSHSLLVLHLDFAQALQYVRNEWVANGVKVMWVRYCWRAQKNIRLGYRTTTNNYVRLIFEFSPCEFITDINKGMVSSGGARTAHDEVVEYGGQDKPAH